MGELGRLGGCMGEYKNSEISWGVARVSGPPLAGTPIWYLYPGIWGRG